MVDNGSEMKNDCMGYKDREKALYTLSCLAGRDISYQYRVITHYHTSAKKTLRITKDEKKRHNICEAMKIFAEWLQDYKDNDRGKMNLPYLPIETIEGFKSLATNYGISDTSFYEAYKRENGDYKGMRSVKVNGEEETTWDIERNKRLREIIKKVESNNLEWYETKDGSNRQYPSKDHVECIFLAYSPDRAKLKALIPEISKLSEPENTKGKSIEEKKIPTEKRSRSNNELDVDDEPIKKIGKKERDFENEGEETTLGFKDKEKALQSIRSLEGRDISYQFHALSGLLKRAERVITCTKDKAKIKNIKEAIEVLENWLTEYNVNNRSKENFAYLSLDLVKAYEVLAQKYDLQDFGFVRAYEMVDGDYKKLRAVKVPNESITWDIERNKRLGSMVNNIKEKHKQWFETDVPFRGLPSKEHTECIMWGFSHEPAKLKKNLKLLNEKFENNGL